MATETNEDFLVNKVNQAIARDTSYICYLYREDASYLEINGEVHKTPRYSFSEITEIVRNAFEENNPVRHVEPIGFRGEVLISDKKELEIFATGSAGVIEYRVSARGQR